MKRFLAILLVIAMLPISATFAREAEPTVIPDAAFDAVTADVWEDIEAIEADEVVAVRGKKATEEIKTLAVQNHIALLETKLTMYESSGRLYEGGLGR